jgi:FlaA1/EpsC-like NDP-sugar epimerase
MGITRIEGKSMLEVLWESLFIRRYIHVNGWRTISSGDISLGQKAVLKFIGLVVTATVMVFLIVFATLQVYHKSWTELSTSELWVLMVLYAAIAAIISFVIVFFLRMELSRRSVEMQ